MTETMKLNNHIGRKINHRETIKSTGVSDTAVCTYASNPKVEFNEFSVQAVLGI